MNFKKKLFASLVASSMMFGAVAPAFASTVTIPADLEGHTFVAYQIFKGEESTGGVLSDIEWGGNINAANFLDALKKAKWSTTGVDFSQCTTDKPAEVAEQIAKMATHGADAEQVAKLVLANKTGDGKTLPATGQTYDLGDGYYLISDIPQDGDGQQGQVYNPSILKIAGEDITIEKKTDKPSVDKRVLDEQKDATADPAGEAAGETGITGWWNESADHQIKEDFKFKLTATIPANTKVSRYDDYKIVFVDEYSADIDFVGNKAAGTELPVSVTITDAGGKSITVSQAAEGKAGYIFSLDKTNRKLTVTINDIKEVTGADTLNLDSELKVTVIYDAHLNSAATSVGPGTSTQAADNKVKLQYSNKPDATGDGTFGDKPGETPEDYVYVFTYKSPNKKVNGSKEGKPALAGAGFTLYKEDGTTVVPVLWDATLNNNTGGYRLAQTGETPVANNEMFSGGPDKTEGNGDFTIYGLDKGKYVLKETTTPDGFNTVAPTTIEITAVHSETAAGPTTTMTLKANDTEIGANETVTIENKQGTVLPETGGMGTTIFYTTGLILTVGAGVLLITKKRMNGGAE